MTDLENSAPENAPGLDEAQVQPAETHYATSARTKYVLFGVILVLAFSVAYGLAAARGRGPVTTVAGAAANGSGSACTGCETGAEVPEADAAASPAAGTGACDGCTSATPSEQPQAAATLANGVQRIAVDVSAGYFDPTVIDLAAGVPTEITFSEGSGCMAEVEFPDFKISEDLTSGGAVVKLPALQPGEYGFNCGMQMVFGTLVVH